MRVDLIHRYLIDRKGDNVMKVVSKIINVSNSTAATTLNGILECSTFAKGDSWANTKK